MGKFHNGVLGTMTGKVGGVVGRTWKGINTVASYQPNVSNPRTNSQMAQRGKLSALTALASQLNTGFIKPLWDRDAKKMSGFNAFIQANMAAVSDSGVIDLENLVVSKGKMSAPQILGVLQNSDTLDISFSTDITDSYGLPTDKVYCVAIDENGDVAAINSGTEIRSSGLSQLPLPVAANFLGSVYLAFRRADGSLTSMGSVSDI